MRRTSRTLAGLEALAEVTSWCRPRQPNNIHLLVTTGAGMGVDSGLPDFRGVEGFWRAYPPVAALGLRLEEMSTPHWFQTDPELAWGFFGHRLRLYRETRPHRGYETLRRWRESGAWGSTFFRTSNVDMHHQFSGAARSPEAAADGDLFEIHGSLSHLQCSDGTCADGHGVWPTPPDLDLAVTAATLRADPRRIPRCPHCDAVARPNILMFGDTDFCEDRCDAQSEAFDAWERSAWRDGGRIPIESDTADVTGIVLEIGAGEAVPTIRLFGEHVVCRDPRWRLIRVNVRDTSLGFADGRGVAIDAPGVDAIEALDELLFPQTLRPADICWSNRFHRRMN